LIYPKRANQIGTFIILEYFLNYKLTNNRFSDVNLKSLYEKISLYISILTFCKEVKWYPEQISGLTNCLIIALKNIPKTIKA